MECSRIFIIESRSKLFGTSFLGSGFFNWPVTFPVLLRWRTSPLSSDVCEIVSRLLVLHIMGKPNLQSFVYTHHKSVVHFLGFLLTGTGFSLHTSFEIINTMLLYKTTVPQSFVLINKIIYNNPLKSTTPEMDISHRQHQRHLWSVSMGHSFLMCMTICNSRVPQFHLSLSFNRRICWRVIIF
jgi:hypothetical protein